MLATDCRGLHHDCYSQVEVIQMANRVGRQNHAKS